ncbi:MAG: lipopolysaccharide heptosyltransferase I [Legionellales bacterium]|nr:lipopolysaccharide heptosyltransferase I [Legionellales bacterium]
MKVLLVKTSSMGDVIHALPAVSDVLARVPSIELDWLVEQAYAPIVQWHPGVQRVIPIRLRHWRRQGWAALRSGEIYQAVRQLRQQPYDCVIDAQGLVKSLLWVLLSRHRQSHGYDRHSIRGRGISWLYDQQASVSWDLSAVQRIRHLFAQVFNYTPPVAQPDYGIAAGMQSKTAVSSAYVTCFPNSSAANRYWPVSHWQQLIERIIDAGLAVQLSAGTAQEFAYCQQLVVHPKVEILNQYSIAQLGPIIANATAVVGLDTGLVHLATAMHKPTVTLHGPTRLAAPDQWQVPLTANVACAPCLKRVCQHPEGMFHDIAPCLASIEVDTVWQALQAQLINR